MSKTRRAREYQRKRQQQLELKHRERRERKERLVRITALIAAGAMVLGLASWGILAALAGTDDPAPVVSPSPSPDDAASPGTSPDPVTTPDPTTTGDDEDLATSGWSTSPVPPGPELAEDRTWTATLATNQGDITVELDGASAPQAVASFVSLAQEGFFDRSSCHRLTTSGIFVLQCGDPTGTGTGGPTYRFGPVENVPEDNVYAAGTLAMARVSGDGESMGSQFFVVYDDSPIPADAAGGYTVFGRVVDGLAIVEDVARAGTITGEPDGRPAQSVILNEVSVS